jgi:outer membrane biosynthesis protein TonB
MPTEKTYNRILAYLTGKLSHRQRHDLEKEMMRDVFDEEAFEGLSQLSGAELRADMDQLENNLQNRISQHKKGNLTFILRLAAGILLLAGLTGIFYVIFRTPSASLISKEEVRKTGPESITPSAPLSAPSSAPLMETESAPAQPLKKEIPEIQKSKKAASRPTAVLEKEEEPGAFKMDTVPEKDDLLAQEEVEVVSYADKKMKSIEKPLTNEPAPDASVRPEQALQGKAAGVQVSSRADYESKEISKEQAFPGLSNPVPPGGSLKAFKKWVDDRLDYPSYKGYPGKYKITVEITVHANGTISNIRVNESVPDIIAADLKKVISQSSLWTAALKEDNPVDADVKIHFVVTVE